jgi:uncharacterized protein (DUF169 family)
VVRLRSAEEWADIPLYRGISYCDAVHRAMLGERLRVLPGSIEICQWAPVVLGLKEPRGRFERDLQPRLEYPVAGFLLAPLDVFPGEPEVVLCSATPDQLLELIESADLWEGHAGQMDLSALPALLDRRANARRGLISTVNRVLASLAQLSAWQAATRWLFRSRLLTAGYDALISRLLADMSVCRNSTVIPMLTGLVNISFFCTGGITWGRNRADHLISGWPSRGTSESYGGSRG